MTVSQELARFCSGLSYEDIPEEVIHRAKMCILDMLGVMVAAWEEESTRILLDYFGGLGGQGQATVLVSGERLPAQSAALINGAMGHSLELEDHHSHTRSLNHPGVTTIPPALAVGESLGVSGKELLTAVVLGYEVGSRVGGATRIGVLNLERGFHETSVCGPFSGAAAAGKLMGFGEDDFARAFGIAGCLPAGNTEFKSNGAWTKRLQVGNASRNGVVAAELARRGFTAPLTIFEGKHGFFESYVLKGNYDLSEVTRGLGEDWEITKIIYKAFGCGGVLHSAVTAAQNLYRRCRPDPDSIDSVEVRTSTPLVKEYAEPLEVTSRPETEVAAQFSLPYAVAVTLVRGEALVDEFSTECIRDRTVLEVAGKVKPVADPEIDREWPSKDPTVILLRLKNGRTITERVLTPKGELGNPVTDDELLVKFRRLTGREFSDERVKRAEEYILNLERSRDAGQLARLLSR